MGKLILIVFIFVTIIGIFLYRQRSDSTPNFYSSPNPNFGFEDCVNSEGAIVTDNGYIKKCQTSDLVSYYQNSDAPIDISKWTSINSGFGFSLLCPNDWTCRTDPENGYVNLYNPNFRISTFGVTPVTPANFQQSQLRHPDYKTPLSWYNAVKAKNKNAVKVLPSTIKPVSGTDGLLYPAYSGYNLDQMVLREATEGGGLAFFKDESDGNILIPLDNQDLILVVFSPWNLSDSPVFKEILRSIKPINSN